MYVLQTRAKLAHFLTIPSKLQWTWYRNRQEDANEFLLDLAHGNTFLDALLTGRYEAATLQCSVCPTSRAVGAHEMDSVFKSIPVVLQDDTTGCVHESLQDALEYTLLPALMDENLTWQCEECGDCSLPQKTKAVRLLPVLLIVGIQQHKLQGVTNIIDCIAVEPVSINRDIVLVNEDYQLCSIIFHSGRDTCAGHYITLVRHATDDGPQFFVYNDSIRYPCDAHGLFTRMDFGSEHPTTFYATTVKYEKVLRACPSVQVPDARPVNLSVHGLKRLRTSFLHSPVATELTNFSRSSLHVEDPLASTDHNDSSSNENPATSSQMQLCATKISACDIVALPATTHEFALSSTLNTNLKSE